MADAKVTALSGFTPVLTDLVYGVDDPGGTPASGKLTLQQILTLIQANISITESQISDLGTYLTSISGEALDDLGDVVITSVASDEIIKWNGTAWINNTLAEAGIAAASHTHTATEVTDFETTFDTLLTAELSVSVQPYDAGLADIAGLAVTDGNIIVGDGANWVAESGATARTSLGVGTGNTPQFTGIEVGHASDTTLSRTGAGVIAVEGVEVTLNTATQTLTNKTLTDPAIVGAILEDIYTISDGAAFEIDPSNGTMQQITLGASRTPKATNFANGESILLRVADGTAYTITWTDATFGGSGVVWAGGSAPTLATTGYSVIVLWKWANQVYGLHSGDHA